MKAVVRISLKEGIRDPQGQALAEALLRLGYQVGEVRCGRLVELEIPGADKEQAEAQLTAMSDQLLANPLIEQYRVETIQN